MGFIASLSRRRESDMRKDLGDMPVTIADGGWAIQDGRETSEVERLKTETQGYIRFFSRFVIPVALKA
jgi:hypothetical protein